VWLSRTPKWGAKAAAETKRHTSKRIDFMVLVVMIQTGLMVDGTVPKGKTRERKTLFTSSVLAFDVMGLAS